MTLRHIILDYLYEHPEGFSYTAIYRGACRGAYNLETDAGRVAGDDEIKAALLDILYSQPGHRSESWQYLQGITVSRFAAIAGEQLNRTIHDAMVDLLTAGQVVWRAKCYQLSTNVWLAMTRAKQQCSTSSTSSPTTARASTLSTRSCRT